MRHWFVSPLSPRELEDVKSIIDHALAVAPNSPEAHVARGVFFYWAHRQYDDAVAEFNRALELQPNNALAQQFLGWVYRRRGEWERSIADAQRAQELDPRDPSIPSSLGGIYAALRLWNDAERVELRTLTLDPYNTVAATLLALPLSWVYVALGRNADALRLAREAAASIPIEKDAVAGPTFQIGLAQIEARAGAPEEAIKRLRHLLSIPAGQVSSIARLKIDPGGIPFVIVPISSSFCPEPSKSDRRNNPEAMSRRYRASAPLARTTDAVALQSTSPEGAVWHKIAG